MKETTSSFVRLNTAFCISLIGSWIWWSNIKWKKPTSSVIQIFTCSISESLSQQMPCSCSKMRINIPMCCCKCFKINNYRSSVLTKSPLTPERLKFSNKLWKRTRLRLLFPSVTASMKKKALNNLWRIVKTMPMCSCFLSKMIKKSQFQIFFKCIFNSSIHPSKILQNLYLSDFPLIYYINLLSFSVYAQHWLPPYFSSFVWLILSI